MINKKTAVFTHSDLDGATSYIVLQWFYPNTVFEVNVVRNAHDFRQNYLNWCVNHKPSEYDKIFVLDLDISGNEDLVDRDNFVIVDHHLTHEKTVYSHAKAFVKTYSSCCKLLWKLMSNKFSNVSLTDAQKKLIALADDYDSYTLKSPMSKQLNTLFWNLSDNFNTFCKTFKNGFNGFSIQQLTLLKITKQEYDNYIQNIKEIYKGYYTYKNKKYSVCSFFADRFINDLADEFLDKEKVDIVFMYNAKSNKISVRRSKTCDVNVGELCETWGGGGHQAAGGAPVGEGFLELSKDLTCVPR